MHVDTKNKVQRAVGVLVTLVIAVGGIAIASTGETVEGMERAYRSQLEAAKASVEALCRAEQALAKIKLDAKGAAYLPVGEIARLQLKAKGENLQCRF